MNVKVIWDNEEHTILRQIYTHKVTAEACYEALEVTVQMMESAHQPVDLILHFQSDRLLAENQNFLNNVVGYIRREYLPNESRIVFVVSRRALQYIGYEAVNYLNTSQDHHYAMVDNLQHAYALLDSRQDYNEDYPASV